MRKKLTNLSLHCVNCEDVIDKTQKVESPISVDLNKTGNEFISSFYHQENTPVLENKVFSKTIDHLKRNLKEKI
jgi:hypothetical protein